MNCEQVQALLVSYLDRETTPSEQTLIRAHLAGCAVCREEMARLSTARSRIGSTLQRRAAQAVPSSKAWERLEARLEGAAQPSPAPFRAWFSHPAPGAKRLSDRLSSGGATMRKRLILATGVAVLAVAALAVSMFNSVTPVSAQQILDRATAAQSARSQAQGLWHYRIEVYKNPLALAGDQPGTTTIEESYEDMAHGLYRSVTRDPAGNVVEISALDNSFSYWMQKPGNGTLPVERVPYAPDSRKPKPGDATSDTSPTSLFDWFRSNPSVELQGQETWMDGSRAYALVDRSYQTYKSPNGQEDKTYTGSTKMLFRTDTYALLESETSVVRAGKEIVIERVRFLVQEVLPAGTSVAWDLSDLKGITFVDKPAEVKVDPQNDPTIPVDITMQELASHPQTYALKTIPAGYSMRIVAAPSQPAGQPYAYEIIYTGPAKENIDLMAVGVMDPGFIETNFYDGSYKTAAGLMLNFSSGTPAGSKNGSSSMLTTPGKISFLFSSTLSRTQLEALAEQIVPLH